MDGKQPSGRGRPDVTRNMIDFDLSGLWIVSESFKFYHIHFLYLKIPKSCPCWKAFCSLNSKTIISSQTDEILLLKVRWGRFDCRFYRLRPWSHKAESDTDFNHFGCDSPVSFLIKRPVSVQYIFTLIYWTTPNARCLTLLSCIQSGLKK